jgi:UDP-2-acetamido-2-deoxy-ribo-hexuluronate aminotransferase
MAAIPAAAQKTDESIPFIDLQAHRQRLGRRIDEAINAVLAHGQFILGPEVHRLEEQLAAHSGASHAVACPSGTDALVLALMALGVDPTTRFSAHLYLRGDEAVALVGCDPGVRRCPGGDLQPECAQRRVCGRDD